MDGKPFGVVDENFSRTGFLFAGDVDLPVGTLVSVGLSGAGVREAKVVRRDGQRYGCEFLMPLPRRELNRAFKGQQDVVADLEAEIERRFRAAAEPAQAPEPSPPEPHRRGLLQRWWEGRR
jgi:hypothetical protein